MEAIKHLKEGDYIAFRWDYFSGVKKKDDKSFPIEVAEIIYISETTATVSFLYGYKSVSEDVKFEDIFAIGRNEGTDKIEGWSGKFITL